MMFTRCHTVAADTRFTSPLFAVDEHTLQLIPRIEWVKATGGESDLYTRAPPHGVSGGHSSGYLVGTVAAFSSVGLGV